MKCTLNSCLADASEVIAFTLKDYPNEPVQRWGYCPLHIDAFAESLRVLGRVVIEKVGVNV